MPDLIEDFRQNIRKLRPDGDDGFEGLIAAVLSDLTKRSFALASAGSQHGKDEQSALDGGTIVFEAKRYDDPIPKVGGEGAALIEAGVIAEELQAAGGMQGVELFQEQAAKVLSS
jgi:hypothetical protein